MNQTYLQTFPVSGTKWLVSPKNGWSPRWRAGDPQELFRGLVSMGPHNDDIGPDGRFLALTRPSAMTLAPITVVQNWKVTAK